MAIADTAKLLASLELEDKLSPKAKAAIGSVSALEKQVASTGSAIQKHLGQGLATAAKNIQRLAYVAIGAGIGGIGLAINAASDLSETVSKVGVVFKSAAGRVIAFGKSAAASLGMSENEALTAAGTYGNLFVSMGMTADKAADMSVSLVKLAGDLASFNNMDPAEVLEKLRAGLTGESEPLKSLGVNINEAAIKQEALNLKLIKGKQPLDAAAKAQAAYSLILKQTKTAQGDFARTSGGLANQLRIMRAGLNDAAATLGTKLLPVATKVVTKFNEFLNRPDTMAALDSLGESLGAGFERVLAVVDVIPWSSVSDAMKVMGTGARALLDAFLKMPVWVQTAVLTGWGLNKLTGGMVTNLIGDLGRGLIKGVLNMNAGVVNINAAAVKGGGIPTGGAPVAAGAAGTSILAAATQVFGAGAMLAAIQALAQQAYGAINPGGAFGEQHGLTNMLFPTMPNVPGMIQRWIDTITGNAPKSTATGPGADLINNINKAFDEGLAAWGRILGITPSEPKPADVITDRGVEEAKGKHATGLGSLTPGGEASRWVRKMADGGLKLDPKTAVDQATKLAGAFDKSTSPSLTSMKTNMGDLKRLQERFQAQGDVQTATKLGTLLSIIGGKLDTLNSKEWVISQAGTVISKPEDSGGTKPPPKQVPGKGGRVYDGGLSINVSTSSRDVTTATMIRGRYGPTPAQAGAA